MAIAARGAARSAEVVNRREAERERAVAYRCDVAEPTDCAETLARCHEGLGGLDVLFNNAGVIFRE